MSQNENTENEQLEFEKFKFKSQENIEKERLKFEKLKFAFQMVAIVVSIFCTFSGARIAFLRYSDEKQRKYDQLYFKTLANLEIDDPNIQKASLLELCRFTDKYAEIVPILIDFLEIQKKQEDVTLEQTLLTTFFIIGKPMVQELAKENRNSFGKNEDRFNVVQWAIAELIKRDIGYKLKGVDLHGIVLKRIDLKNLAISSISLRGATMDDVNFNGTNFIGIDLSETTFNNCQFWQTIFEKGTNLKKATFSECTFKDTLFDCDLTEAKLPGSTCENIVITNENYIVKDPFQEAISCTFSINTTLRP